MTRADFKQHGVGHGKHPIQSVGKAHRIAQVPNPVFGVGQGLRLDPGAGEVRDKSNRRRLKRNGADPRAETIKHTIKQARMRCNIDTQAAAFDRLPCQALLKLGDGFERARCNAKVRAVDGGDVEWQPVDGAPQTGFGKVNRQHRTGRHGFKKLAAQTDHRQSVFKRHHAGQTGCGVLAGAVTHHSGWLDAPAFPQFGERIFESE